MAVLDIVIEILRINCSMVECNYANPLEGLFNLLFFPSVFIILLIFMLANFVLGRAGLTDNKMLHLILTIALFAFIIFQDLYTMFVSLSTVWFYAVILLVGLFVILKMFFKGEGGRSTGALHAIPGGKGGKSLVKRVIQATGRDPDLGLLTQTTDIKVLERNIEKIDDAIAVQEDLKKNEPDERSRNTCTIEISRLKNDRKATENRIKDLKAARLTEEEYKKSA
jgi:hypothetical protein